MWDGVEIKGKKQSVLVILEKKKENYKKKLTQKEREKK
jgi:hypothetical protein